MSIILAILGFGFLVLVHELGHFFVARWNGVFVEEFSIETALVVCEIYRYNGDWKFNAVAAGYQGGLEALCRAYGVNV